VSTILKALKRLEAEREVQAPRPLREEVVAALEAAETVRQQRGRRWRLLAVASAGALVATGAAWLVLPRLSETLGGALRGSLSRPGAAGVAAPTAASQPAARATASAAPPAAPPQLAAGPSPSSVDSAAEPPLGSGAGSEASLPAATGAAPGEVPLVAVVQRPPPEPAFQDDEPPAAAPVAPPPGSIPPAPKQAPSFAAAPAVDAPPGSAAAVDRPAPSPPDEAVAESPRRARAAAPAPRPRSPARVRVANARDVDVLRTVWHPHPERRLALLLLPGESAARELREGDTAQGWTVLTIEPSSVVLLHDGVELRAAVGGGGR